MPATGTATLSSVPELSGELADRGYIADSGLSTALFLALRLERPLFLEGEAGVGKTELAKVTSGLLGAPLIRLQCYEGLDIAQAAYEWNYTRQMLAIRLSESRGRRWSSRTCSGGTSFSAGRCCTRSRARHRTAARCS